MAMGAAEAGYLIRQIRGTVGVLSLGIEPRNKERKPANRCLRIVLQS